MTSSARLCTDSHPTTDQPCDNALFPNSYNYDTRSLQLPHASMAAAKAAPGAAHQDTSSAAVLLPLLAVLADHSDPEVHGNSNSS